MAVRVLGYIAMPLIVMSEEEIIKKIIIFENYITIKNRKIKIQKDRL